MCGCAARTERIASLTRRGRGALLRAVMSRREVHAGEKGKKSRVIITNEILPAVTTGRSVARVYAARLYHSHGRCWILYVTDATCFLDWGEGTGGNHRRDILGGSGRPVEYRG